MLFEFHRKQNAKKPGSIHATYLLDGIPKPIIKGDQTNGHPPDGDDMPMQSSPFVSSAVQEEDKPEEYAAPSRSIILAREEDLERAKSKLETIHSIHVYSLQPNTLQNLQVLSDCNRTISANFNSEDPLIVGQKYGVIHNNGVRRRSARRPPPGVAPAIATAPKVSKAILPKPTEENKTSPKADNPSMQESTTKTENPSSSRPTTKASNKAPTLKKEHSDIFKSFSKTKAPLIKETSDTTTINSPAPHSQESSKQMEDEPMKDDDDDDDQGNDAYIPPNNKADPHARTARSQRAEQLRKMMDDDDDHDDEKLKGSDEDEDDEMPDVDKEPPPTSTSPDPPAQKSPTPEPTPVISNGRRRGRRKIMKKKTVKDDEGNLVTKEEPAWESFSEEERAPPVSSSSTVGGGKGKKMGSSAGAAGGGKVGQGNIMNFFGKK